MREKAQKGVGLYLLPHRLSSRYPQKSDLPLPDFDGKGAQSEVKYLQLLVKCFLDEASLGHFCEVIRV